jgi:MgtE intracellular N domain
MKVVVLFVVSIGGGLVVGAAGRGFLMDPPAVEEEASADETEPEGGVEVIQSRSSDDVPEGSDHASDLADPRVDTSGTDEQHSSPGEDSPPGHGDEAGSDDVTPRQVSGASPEGQASDVTGEAQDPGPDVGAEDVGAAEARPSTPVATASRGDQGATQADDSAPERLAQIFGSMDAKAAASVLVELSDAEITEILSHLKARKAGEVIKNMPPERAATLSRAMLVQGGGEL